MLTLWAAIVAERLGFDEAEALTLGRAVAGLNAYSKGVAIGLFQPTPERLREQRRELRESDGVTVDLLQRAVPVTNTDEGVRALSKEKPLKPETVNRYLEGKFGDALGDTREAMTLLAASLPPLELADRGYDLYVKFRPDVPKGTRGWGAAGRLSLDRIREMAAE